MEHRLVAHIEKALGWDGPGSVGAAFARGRLTDPDLPVRLLTPHRLLDLIKRRHLANPQLRCYAEGDEVHPSLFLSTNVNRRRQAVSQADMAALGRILNEGGTVVLDHVDFFDPNAGSRLPGPGLVVGRTDLRKRLPRGRRHRRLPFALG